LSLLIGRPQGKGRGFLIQIVASRRSDACFEHGNRMPLFVDVWETAVWEGKVICLFYHSLAFAGISPIGGGSVCFL
jgi:hypothetical protein